MTRFYTVPDAKTARRSVVWVMFLAGAFFAGTTLFGLAAADFVGQDAIRAADKGGNLTLPLLAQYLGGGKGTLGGDVMLGFVAAVAVATILAVVSALTLSTSSAIAHDFYVNWLKRGQVDGRREVWIARLTTILIGLLAIALGVLAQGVNVAVLVILAICIAASANFPVLILSLFWRRFNTGGVVGGMTVGLISSVVLAMIGPAMRGADARCGLWSTRPWFRCRWDSSAPCSARLSPVATARTRNASIVAGSHRHRIRLVWWFGNSLHFAASRSIRSSQKSRPQNAANFGFATPGP